MTLFVFGWAMWFCIVLAVVSPVCISLGIFGKMED
jgi:hypothetical protein